MKVSQLLDTSRCFMEDIFKDMTWVKKLVKADIELKGKCVKERSV